MDDVKGLADEIEREMMTWRGANGGVYTIRACAFAIAQKMASRLESARSAEPVACCLITGNPVGTDTWQLGYGCKCANCAPAPEAPDV